MLCSLKVGLRISIIFLCLGLSYCQIVFSQVKIGDNPKSINADAMLEIESSNKGVLLPRLALKSTKTSSPLRRFVAGMVVYNTSSSNDITPGVYYSDGSKWVRANNNSSSPDSILIQNNAWSLKGNNSQSPNNFLGTTNNTALVVRTNNTERVRITEKGWMGIGTATPKASLEVNGQLIIDSLEVGNPQTDKILVANPIDGKVKILPTLSLGYSVQTYNEIVSTNGQSIFKTPAAATDINKIFLYRNGILISFTLKNNNSIESELPCQKGDQIKIIQLL